MPRHALSLLTTALAAATLGLAACQPATAPTTAPAPRPGAEPTAAPGSPSPAAEVKTLYVGPQMVDCSGVAPMTCLQVRESPDAEWQLFYGTIEGFDYEPGYTYELRVEVSPVANPPADGSSLRLTLVEVVSKTPAAATP